MLIITGIMTAFQSGEDILKQLFVRGLHHDRISTVWLVRKRKWKCLSGEIVVLREEEQMPSGSISYKSCNEMTSWTLTQRQLLHIYHGQFNSPCHSNSAGLCSACRSSCWSCSCVAPTTWPLPLTSGAWTLRLWTSNISGACDFGPAAAAAGTATEWWRCPYLQQDMISKTFDSDRAEHSTSKPLLVIFKIIIWFLMSSSCGILIIIKAASSLERAIAPPSKSGVPAGRKAPLGLCTFVLGP